MKRTYKESLLLLVRVHRDEEGHDSSEGEGRGAKEEGLGVVVAESLGELRADKDTSQYMVETRGREGGEVR
jgi:hypothetical protein